MSFRVARMGSLLFLLIVCFYLQLGAAYASTQELTVAHWGKERVFIYLPFYVAQERGFFQQEGIKVKLIFSGNDDQVFATVASGNAVAGLADPAFAAVSRARGGDGRVIAVFVNRVSNWGVAKKPSIPTIDTPSKLGDLTVSSFPSPSTAYTILADIKKRDKLSGMHIREMSPGTEMAALERGDVDIALTGEPAISLAESRGYRVVLSLASYYGPFAFSGVTTTDRNISKHRASLAKLVRGLDAATRFIYEKPDKVVPIAERLFPNLSHDVIQRAVGRMLKDGSIPTTVRVDSVAWDRAIEMRKSVGDIPFTFDALSVPDNSLLDTDENRHGGTWPSPVQSGNRGDEWWGALSHIADIVTILGIGTLLGVLVGYRKAQRMRRRIQTLSQGNTTNEQLRALDNILTNASMSMPMFDLVQAVAARTSTLTTESEGLVRELLDEGVLELKGDRVQCVMNDGLSIVRHALMGRGIR